MFVQSRTYWYYYYSRPAQNAIISRKNAYLLKFHWDSSHPGLAATIVYTYLSRNKENSGHLLVSPWEIRFGSKLSSLFNLTQTHPFCCPCDYRFLLIHRDASDHTSNCQNFTLFPAWLIIRVYIILLEIWLIILKLPEFRQLPENLHHWDSASYSPSIKILLEAYSLK